MLISTAAAVHAQQVWCIPFCEGCANQANDIEDTEVAEGGNKGEADQRCSKCQLIGPAKKHLFC